MINRWPLWAARHALRRSPFLFGPTASRRSGWNVAQGGQPSTRTKQHPSTPLTEAPQESNTGQRRPDIPPVADHAQKLDPGDPVVGQLGRTKAGWPARNGCVVVIRTVHAHVLYLPKIARIAARLRVVIRGSVLHDAARISCSHAFSFSVTAVPMISIRASAAVSPSICSRVSRKR